MRTPSSSSSTWWGWSIAWVGLLLSLQVAAEAQSNASSWDTTTATFFLPHHDHDQYGERAVNVAYDTRRTVGPDFWQCCKWTWPPQNASAVAHPEIRSLDCSILGRSEEFDDQGTGIRSAADFCLHVCGFSSIHRSYIVGVDASEPLRADAVVSLALYLANRSSTLWPAQVLARVACRREHAPCRLTIAGAATIAMSGGLGFVEWMGRFSGSQAYYEVAHPSRFEFAFRVSTPLADQVLGFGRRSLLERRGIPRNVAAFFHWQGLVLGMLMSLAGVSTVAVLCAGKKGEESPSAFLDTVTILPPRFSYSKLQKATKNYYQKLGDGAFGSVYEGTLPNGVRVAVKMLEKASVQGEKQFRAEVASMGAIRHLNLVRLHGFCSEGSHRLLVYEFMPNGSLDSWLFGKKQGEKLLDWEQRLNIALGTARALAYLHEECSDHIIHLDVKPENILLDHQFCPKLSDFGLAKLMDREQSRVVTSMRGTPGYLAPEWLLPQAAVTAKTDVYSFGMVLLELISGRENTNFSLGKEQWYFPAWAFKLMSEGRTMELLDKRLHVEEVEYFHKEDAMRAIHVALLCIQDDPAARPPMSRVVHMLQGHVEPEPLNAQQSAINPPRRLMTAFAASGADANPKENITSINNNNNNNNNHNDSTNGDLPRKSRSDPRRDSRADPRSDLRRDSRADSKSSRDDSRKNSWSNENDPILTELQKDMRNDYYNRMTPAAATTPILSSRLPAVTESPPPPSRPPRHSPSPPTTHHARHPHELSPNADSFKLEPRESPPPLQMLPPAVQGASHHRLNTSDRRAAGAHALGSSNHKCIPPWPVQGDVILLRGGGGAAGHADFLAVVRAVREQSKLMRLALLQRGASDARLVVRAEESAWRHWNESIRTLDFWVAVRWAAIPGRGFEKFPVEWQLR